MPNAELWDQGVCRERVVDNGDGTGTRTTYDDQGVEVEVEQLTGLPIFEPEPEPVDPLAVFDAATTGTLSMTKLKNAYRAALVALLET